jgi:DnaK suppressor protein
MVADHRGVRARHVNERAPAAPARSLDTRGVAALLCPSFCSPGGGLGNEGSALNKKDLKRFKTMLEESKKQLLLSAKKTLTEESSFDTDDLPDEIDLASSEYTQSMIFRLRDREKFLLTKIDKALTRIENGSFGVCEKCEEEISMKRLEARPVTTLCIRCKEEQEQKEKSFG